MEAAELQKRIRATKNHGVIGVHPVPGWVIAENWRKNFSEGDFNRWTLNHVLAVHPAARFLTALIFKSKINGRTKLHYPDSRFLKDIKFESLNEPGKPYIFHNAWNLSKQELQLFSNRDPASTTTSGSPPQACAPARPCR